MVEVLIRLLSGKLIDHLDGSISLNKFLCGIWIQKCMKVIRTRYLKNPVLGIPYTYVFFNVFINEFSRLNDMPAQTKLYTI